MDLCFIRRFVYLACAIVIWGYDNWAAMSHETTTSEGPRIASGCATEGLVS